METITKETIAAQLGEYLAANPDKYKGLTVEDKEALITEYWLYANRPRHVHNVPMRDDGQSFFDAMDEIDSLGTPEENKRFYDTMNKVCS